MPPSARRTETPCGPCYYNYVPQVIPLVGGTLIEPGSAAGGRFGSPHRAGLFWDQLPIQASISADQKGGDMTTPEPEPTEYPSNWVPRHIKEREQERAEFEIHVAALTDEDLKRIRGDR